MQRVVPVVVSLDLGDPIVAYVQFWKSRYVPKKNPFVTVWEHGFQTITNVNRMKSDSCKCLRHSTCVTAAKTFAQFHFSGEEWEMLPNPLKYAISFSGAGFLGIYHLGVINALSKHGLGLTSKISKFAGASAGALAACLMAVAPEKLEDAKSFLIRTAVHINGLRGGPLNREYDVMTDLEFYIRSTLPDDAFTRARGRVFISITNATKRSNFITSSFASNEELVKCLLATCYIPGYAKSEAPSFSDGERTNTLIDGGFTDNLPKFKDIPTISVSPFSGHTDICPQSDVHPRMSITVNKLPVHLNSYNIVRGVQALFPPKEKTMLQHYNLGFDDCVRYLKKIHEYRK